MGNLNEIKEYLPFLIPLAAVEIGLFVYTIIHIFRHKRYKFGNRALWLIITIIGMNFIGPILYLIFGKEED